MPGSPTIRLYQVTFTEGTDAVGAIKNMVDINTEQEDFTLLRDNILLDALNTPEPGDLVLEIQLWKGGADTGKRFYTSGMNPASAGRVAVGPITFFTGRFQWKAKVLSFGTLSSAAETYGLGVKYDKMPN